MSAVLEVDDLSVDYGGGRVLNKLCLSVDAGEIVAVLGPNGAGKTSALKAISGLIGSDGGVVRVGTTDISRLAAEKRSRLGVFLVPDDRGLFSPIPVHAHLSLAAHTRSARACRPMVEEHFPGLIPRWDVRASSLSGGEAQMLSLAMALAAEPKVLLIDELSFGLAPIVVRRLLSLIRDIATRTGLAVLMVEQLIDLALTVADRGIVLRRDIMLEGTAAELAADQNRLHEAYFGASVGSSAERANPSPGQPRSSVPSATPESSSP